MKQDQRLRPGAHGLQENPGGLSNAAEAEAEASIPLQPEGDLFDPEADLSREDLDALSSSIQNRNLDDPDAEQAFLDNSDEEGEPLNELHPNYGGDGADLDVPGANRDDADEAIGEEDEENNYYSLGQDRHSQLEDDDAEPEE